MKKIALLLLGVCLIIQAWGQVSDNDVIQMVLTAQKQGMSQQQIAVMLLQKGVTKEQLLRLKDTYEKGELNLKDAGNVTTDTRIRQLPLKQNDKKTDSRYLKEDELTGKPLFEAPRGENVSFIDSIGNIMQPPYPVETEKSVIFGKDIFNNTLLTFEPQLNIATPDNYLLGPGDEVIIDIWGNSEANIRQVISPDGNIVVQGIGPVYLNGLTVKEANARVKNEFSKIYAIASGNVSIRLTLGQIRSIQVNVMGEVAVPGTYTLPSLASAFHALYNAGGVNPIGSLRSIKIYRNGKEVADVDIYEYIMQGKNDLNILLQDGDVIVVSPYVNLVDLSGKVKRPMIYEMKNQETVADILSYAGGFTGDAYKKNVRVIRKSGREHQIYNVDENNFDTFIMTDGDQISVDSVLPRFENKVEIKGAVYREGLYAIGEGVNTLKELLDKAEGVRGDAFLNRAVLYREKPDLTLEVLSVDIAGLIEGTAEDIALKKNDVLYVPSVFDLQEDFTIVVKGAVRNPGTYKFADNMTLEDLVIQCGGLLESASTVKIDVARRIKDPKSTTVGDMRAETFTFTLKDGLITGGQPGFTLKPFDEVYIRRSPGYQEQQDVFVDGEVMFGGEYALAKKGERLSDIVIKAGGLTPEAYPEGARLMRKTTPEEKKLIQQTIMKLTQQGGNDTIDMALMNLGDYYPVGIELKKALENPGSDYDVILKEGDQLVIPEYSGTVKISGAVMYPNTVVYKPKAKTSYYISQAGGFAQRARKRRAFVIYMNGTVAVARGGRLDIKPGCEIIVPLKQPRKGLGLAEIMSLTTSTTSMAAMITSIINSTK